MVFVRSNIGVLVFFSLVLFVRERISGMGKKTMGKKEGVKIY